MNAILIGVQLLAFAACAYASAHVSGWALVGLAVVFGILMNSVYAIIHEAEHAMLFSHRGWNEWMGSIMALLFPAPFHLIRQGHLGHHLRNRSDDEAFDLYFEEDHRLWKILVLYGILTGFYYLIVVLSNVVFLVLPFREDKKYLHVDRATTAFLEALNPRYRLLIRLEGAAVLVLHAGIIWGLGIPLLHYLAMYAGFGFMWSAMQYVHHYGTERHVTRGARNLWIFGPVDALLLNHNWHRAHHENPTVPWVYLPALGQAQSPRRGFLPWAYLKMWKGPRRTDEHVENKYAGRVIQ